MRPQNRTDIYTRITAEIIAAIEAGADAYRMPWHHDGTSIAQPRNVVSGKAYRGVNILALWITASRTGYPTGVWGTYRQWQALGAQVRKGEQATAIVFWGQRANAKEEANEDADADAADRPHVFARGYAVFNQAQVDRYTQPAAPEAPELAETERLAHAEAFFANLGIPTIYGGSEAYYRPVSDTVFMPAFERFHDGASFYGTLAHECGHATGAKDRLDRDLTGRFGSASYAAEEILVEISAGYILADLAIAHHPRPDHAAYVASWLKVLKGDPRAIFTAASKAQAVADWMHARQPSADAAPS